MSVEIKKYGPGDEEMFCADFDSKVLAGQDAAAGTRYIFVMTTEEIGFCEAQRESFDRKELFDSGLEIRIFDEKSEAKWFRTGIDRPFRFRKRRDGEETEKDRLHHWDESQYLDIDTQRTEDARKSGALEAGCVYATGGGKYPLPIEAGTDARIRIRNYLGEDPDTGELYVEDWRLAGFGEWKDDREV